MRYVYIFLLLLISCSQNPCVEFGYLTVKNPVYYKTDRHLNAIQDYSFALDYIKWVDSTQNYATQKQAISLMIKLAKILKNNQSYNPGYPKFNSNRMLLEKYRFPLMPGMDMTTWCNMFVYDVVEYFYPGRGRIICESRGIYFTDANEMSNLCVMRLHQVSENRAIQLANSGKIIIVSARAYRNSSGHLAILLPSLKNYRLHVAQAGVYNGFIEINTAFAVGMGYVEFPKFFELF